MYLEQIAHSPCSAIAPQKNVPSFSLLSPSSPSPPISKKIPPESNLLPPSTAYLSNSSHQSSSITAHIHVTSGSTNCTAFGRFAIGEKPIHIVWNWSINNPPTLPKRNGFQAKIAIVLQTEIAEKLHTKNTIVLIFMAETNVTENCSDCWRNARRCSDDAAATASSSSSSSSLPSFCYRAGNPNLDYQRLLCSSRMNSYHLTSTIIRLL
jgi:hypothetical protein